MILSLSVPAAFALGNLIGFGVGALVCALAIAATSRLCAPRSLGRSDVFVEMRPLTPEGCTLNVTAEQMEKWRKEGSLAYTIRAGDCS